MDNFAIILARLSLEMNDHSREDISKNRPGRMKGFKFKPTKSNVVHYSNLSEILLFKRYNSLCPHMIARAMRSISLLANTQQK